MNISSTNTVSGVNPALGDKIDQDRFKLLSVLGKGGFGEVWLAHDSKLGKDVAIKFVIYYFK